MKTFGILTILLFFLTGCTKYKDPEIAKRISELESKKQLDEFEKEELRDLKEQGSSDPSAVVNACKLN